MAGPWFLIHQNGRMFKRVSVQVFFYRQVKVVDRSFGANYYSLQLNILNPDVSEKWQQNILQVCDPVDGPYRNGSGFMWNRTLQDNPNRTCVADSVVYEVTQLPPEVLQQLLSFGDHGDAELDAVFLEFSEDRVKLRILKSDLVNGEFLKTIYVGELPWKTIPILGVQLSIVGYGNGSRADFSEADFHVHVEADGKPLSVNVIGDPKDVTLQAVVKAWTIGGVRYFAAVPGGWWLNRFQFTAETSNLIQEKLTAASNDVGPDGRTVDTPALMFRFRTP